MNKIITSFIFIILFLGSSYAQENNNTEVSEKKSYEQKAYEVPANYKETRKIKYLLQEPTGVVVFFDNNKATVIKDFKVCTENMHILYYEPSEYNYEIVAGIMSFSKREDKYATGVKLSSEYWMIKNFIPITEIPNCNQ